MAASRASTVGKIAGGSAAVDNGWIGGESRSFTVLRMTPSWKAGVT